MEKICFIILSLFVFNLNITSQNLKKSQSLITITKPEYEMSSAAGLTLDKLELRDSCTILNFTYAAKAGSWFSIPKETYIQAIPGDEKLFVTSSKGITLNKSNSTKESGKINYTLTFPPIDKSVTHIDYGEANDGGNWHIYDICTQPLKSSIIPEAVIGNWFNKKTGTWEAGIYNDYVVYKSKVWQCESATFKKRTGIIKITNESASIELKIQFDKKGNYQLGTQEYNYVSCTKKEEQLTGPFETDEPYQAPIFKLDSATYSGYIKGYTSRVGAKTMMIHINDILTGNQNSYLIEISANGHFSTKLPVYYPVLCFVRSDIYNGSIYLEPGKEVFQLIGQGTKEMPLYMGESAKINTDLDRIWNLSGTNYNEIMDKILDMTPETYKEWCFQKQNATIDQLDSVFQSGRIGKKAWQIKKYNLQYVCASNIIEYEWNFKSAYRRKYNIPRSQHRLPVETPSLPDDYYDFINDEFASDLLAVVSGGYNTFINRFKYMDILYDNNLSYANLNIVQVLEKAGYSLSEDEKLTISKIKEMEKLAQDPEITVSDRWFDYEFRNKYQNQITELQKAFPNRALSLTEIGDSLLNQGVEFPKEVQAFLIACKKLEKNDAWKQMTEINKEYETSISEFYKKYSESLNPAMSELRNHTYHKSLKDIFGVQPGFVTDVMYSQDKCRDIDSNVTPVSEDELNMIQKDITTPFIVEYIRICNNKTLQKIEENKNKSGYHVNDTPNGEADKVFDSIVEKYKGKVVYVDFWATWCSPCRSGIERIKTLKEEMKDENVVFVYITNQSSPENTWKNMIPDIKGEHYRVSTDQWNYLSSKFNVSGIPHYVLVSKDSKVINGNLSHMDNGSLKKELEKYL